MAGKFVLKKTPSGQFSFQLRAGNGEPILASETYASKSSATKAIASVKTNSAMDARYEKKSTSNGQFMFNLKAGNRQVIGTSETYTTAAARDKGISAVKANAPGAATDDQTASA